MNLTRSKKMESKEYLDCKLACANGLEQLAITKNQMQRISERCVQGQESLTCLMAVGQMIKATRETEKALKIFMERDYAVGLDNRKS